jgi:hypothetical protein
MSKEIMTALGRFIDTRSLGSAAIVLAVILSTVSTAWRGVIDDAAFIVNEPFYYALASDLYKVVGKLTADPADAKRADVDKFARFCSPGDPFVDRYLTERPDARALLGACQKVLALADQWPGAAAP